MKVGNDLGRLSYYYSEARRERQGSGAGRVPRRSSGDLDLRWFFHMTINYYYAAFDSESNVRPFSKAASIPDLVR